MIKCFDIDGKGTKCIYNANSSTSLVECNDDVCRITAKDRSKLNKDYYVCDCEVARIKHLNAAVSEFLYQIHGVKEVEKL